MNSPATCLPSTECAPRPWLRWHGLAALSLASWAGALLVLGVTAGALLTFALFAALILAPSGLLIWRALKPFPFSPALKPFVAAAGTVCVLPFIFLLRKAVPLPWGLFDGILAALLVTSAWLSCRNQGLSLLPAHLHDPQDRWWLGVALPLLFALTWLGHEVHRNGEVRYYSLFFSDGGNLTSIVNLLNTSSVLPQSPVAGQGPLSYHWLYFTLPAWASNFLGLRVDTARALGLTNLLGACLMYKCLSLTCARTLQATGRGSSPWQGHFAGLGMMGVSIYYFYEGVIKLVHQPWLPLDRRNALVLQLPNSLTAFGNNTFAITLCLLTVCALHERETHPARTGLESLGYVLLAASFVGRMAAYSVTLVFCVSMGLAAACLCGFISTRWKTLATFVIVGGGWLAIWSFMDLFSNCPAWLGWHFDRFQFFQNIVVGCLPGVLALGWCAWRARSNISSMLLCLSIAAVLAPSFLLLHGSPSGHVDMSMKTGTLFMTLCIPLAAVCWQDLRQIQAPRRRRWLQLAVASLWIAGFLNTAIYVLQFPYSRLTSKASRSESLKADHFAALDYLRSHSRRDDIVLDALGMRYKMANPTVMIAARRAALPNRANQLQGETNAQLDRELALWKQWHDSRFDDPELSSEIAALTDWLIVRRHLRTADWTLEQWIGPVGIYRSNHSTVHLTAP